MTAFNKKGEAICQVWEILISEKRYTATELREIVKAHEKGVQCGSR